MFCPEFDEVAKTGEAGGCLFAFEEKSKAIGLFSLFTSFRWQSYLYGEPDQTVLFNWEGDILDTWTSAGFRHKAIDELASLCKLQRVSDAEAD
jgi:hypothetical protein